MRSSYPVTYRTPAESTGCRERAARATRLVGVCWSVRRGRTRLRRVDRKREPSFLHHLKRLVRERHISHRGVLERFGAGASRERVRSKTLAPNRFMTHIAMQQANDLGEVVRWREHVTDEQYGQAVDAGPGTETR